MPIIVAEHLSKSYRAAAKEPGMLGTLRHFVRRRYRLIEAVRDVSFSIEPGEIVGFLGPNGAGKTTALKMLSGLIHPTAGRCEVAGHTPFARDSAFLRSITLVMGQKQQLIWDLPVLDSLRINAAVYDIPEAEARRRVDELAAMLGLTTQLTQPVRKLSLGERMKAELMAALLHRPSILFLDEPTLGLDVNAQASVREFLLSYNQRHGATILLTSHYKADITALCRREMLIDKGTLIYDGDLAAMIERLAPCREVRLDLRRAYAAEELAPFGEVRTIEGRAAHLLVRREDLTRVLPRILSDLDVEDLTVGDPPVEQIIGQVFNGQASANADVQTPTPGAAQGAAT
ncbi:MAG: ATP-binding cassette domain-containing protein [Planctomycetota bacterium]|nr:ATP-binding cassette domain-containing protein [Planctomycetota bacterium]